jgi:molybdopterin molybdotransferase
MDAESIVENRERSDPRRKGFRSRATVGEVLTTIDACVNCLGAEEVPLAEAAGRILAVDVVAAAPVPPFDRAAMDGFALRGEETFGADPYSPATFQVVGRSRPGGPMDGRVGPGQAAEIATGAPLPEGADAVAPVESCMVQADRLGVFEPVSPGRHIGRRGEDIETAVRALAAGRRLRPQDLGVLSALGRAVVPVIRRPVVSIVITGDELLPAGTTARGAQIADMNSVMASALVERDGGRPVVIGPLADDPAGLERVLASAVEQSDLVLVSGGSSTGPEDYAPGVVAALGTLAIHGVGLRPASPTGLGFVKNVPIFLLPGNPVSCLCAYDLFAGRAVRRLGGRAPAWPYRAILRPLASKLVSALGRVDYTRVRLVGDRVEPMAIGGASILSSTTRADGFVLVPADLEGYPAGTEVTVWLYDLESSSSESIDTRALT